MYSCNVRGVLSAFPTGHHTLGFNDKLLMVMVLNFPGELSMGFPMPD